ncbi:hypothetical protein KY289_037233 [Solanum tuberosum]|nr:hypothetical protein KY289_037233 [Solanum tuberosum]
MIREISRFKQDVISYLEELDNNPGIDHNETLGSTELFCLLHSFILSRPPSSAALWSPSIAHRKMEITYKQDKRYDSHRQSTDFMREYIFPGGCVPSLSQVTSAMSAASRLCAPGRDRNSLLLDTEMLAKKLPEKTKAKFVLWDSIISSSGHGSTTLTTVLLDSKRAQQEIIRRRCMWMVLVSLVGSNE